MSLLLEDISSTCTCWGFGFSHLPIDPCYWLSTSWILPYCPHELWRPTTLPSLRLRTRSCSLPIGWIPWVWLRTASQRANLQVKLSLVFLSRFSTVGKRANYISLKTQSLPKKWLKILAQSCCLAMRCIRRISLGQKWLDYTRSNETELNQKGNVLAPVTESLGEGVSSQILETVLILEI